MKLDVELSPAQAERLRQEADRLNVTPQELARAVLSGLLSEHDENFKIAAERVLRKYNETIPASGLRHYLTRREVIEPA